MGVILLGTSMKYWIISVVFIFLLGGCTHHYMYRETLLKSLPEVECLVTVINELPEIETVELFLSQTGKRITHAGLEEPGDVYDIRYDGNFVDAQLLIVDGNFKDERQISFRHNLGSYHELLTQSDVDKEREIMIKVENAIAERCGMIEVYESKEHCSGVICNEI